MELYGYTIDGKIVDEITDRIFYIHDYAEHNNMPFVDCRQVIIKAIEDVLWCHNILSIDREFMLTNLKKEDIK